MKLSEIFDIQPADNLEQDNAERLGSGMFAHVYNSKSDPHMANRIQRRDKPFREDAFEIYANSILDSKVNESNPTFPRIYKRSNGKFQVEKLISINDASAEELEAFIENNFNDTEPGKSDIGIIVATIALALDYGEYDNIKNTSIINACKWIKRLADASGTTIDIHDGNLMFRRTPTGLQLVITDPIF